MPTAAGLDQVDIWMALICSRYLNIHYRQYTARTDLIGAQDFGQDLEGLDLTNIAGWDLEAFWNL